MTALFQIPNLAHEAYERLCAIQELLEEIRDNTGGDTAPPTRRQRIPFSFVTNATGDGDQLIQVPQGWQWALLRYSVQIGIASPAGYVAFYREAEVPTLLLAVSSSSQIFNDTFAADGDVVPGQSRVLIVARGLGAVAQVGGNMAVRATQDTSPVTVSN